MAICCLNIAIFQRASNIKTNFLLYFSLLQRYYVIIMYFIMYYVNHYYYNKG